jgi:hypothetical protein
MTNVPPEADAAPRPNEQGAEAPPEDLARQCLTVYRPRPGEEGDLWAPTVGPVEIPPGWDFLSRGEAFITRQVKKGPHWVLKGRFNNRGGYTPVLGVYAPAESIAAARVRDKQTTEQRARARHGSQTRRDEAEKRYRVDFEQACVQFLDLAPEHEEFARSIAREVTEHACVKHSGRVGRSGKLPLADKAALAVRAYVRHVYTDYEQYLPKGLEEEDYWEVKGDAQAEVDRFLQQHRAGGSGVR